MENVPVAKAVMCPVPFIEIKQNKPPIYNILYCLLMYTKLPYMGMPGPALIHCTYHTGIKFRLHVHIPVFHYEIIPFIIN